MDNKETEDIKQQDEACNNQTEENKDTIASNECETTEDNQNSWEQKYATLNDSYVRLMAEFDNYRKRTLKEKLELIQNGGERVISDTLPIVDNFERALSNMESATDVDAIKQGVELIYNQLISMLKQHGVKAIETENQDFDTEYHEAITTIPAPTDDAKGKIVDCTLKGYMLNEKVIRHSKVVVGE